MAPSRATKSGIAVHACGLLTSSLLNLPGSKASTWALGLGPWRMAGKISNGGITFPGSVQMLVNMPGLGSAERHDFGLVGPSGGRGTGGYSVQRGKLRT